MKRIVLILCILFAICMPNFAEDNVTINEKTEDSFGGCGLDGLPDYYQLRAYSLSEFLTIKDNKSNRNTLVEKTDNELFFSVVELFANTMGDDEYIYLLITQSQDDKGNYTDDYMTLSLATRCYCKDDAVKYDYMTFVFSSAPIDEAVFKKYERVDSSNLYMWETETVTRCYYLINDQYYCEFLLFRNCKNHDTDYNNVINLLDKIENDLFDKSSSENQENLSVNGNTLPAETLPTSPSTATSTSPVQTEEADDNSLIIWIAASAAVVLAVIITAVIIKKRKQRKIQ